MTSLVEWAEQAGVCTRCELAEHRTNVVFGMGNPMGGLMFVGEAPGAQEDQEGLPFVGRSGRYLDQLVAEEMGLGRDDFYVANTVKCRPPANRDPRPEETQACRRFLDGQLEVINPRVIVTLGNFAARLLLATDLGITKLRGRSYPFRTGYVVPTFHPAAVMRSGGEMVAQMRADLVRAKALLALPAASLTPSERS